MKTMLISVIGFVLAAFLMVACGDSNGLGGPGGGTVCASDDPEVGNTIDCPSGEETLDFCVNTGSGNCYYVIGGDRVDCGDCFSSGGGNIGNCAQEAIGLCD
jgi:hypothetical protein